MDKARKEIDFFDNIYSKYADSLFINLIGKIKSKQKKAKNLLVELERNQQSNQGNES